MEKSALLPASSQQLTPPVILGEVAREGHPEPKRSWMGQVVWPLLLVVAFAGGWVVAGGGSGHYKKEALPPEEASGRDPSAVVVTVESVTYRPVQRSIEAMGTLHGFEEVSISAKVEGRVRRLHRDAADRVKPGELLLEIDPTDYELSVQQAERGLQVELAKLGFKEPPEPNVDLSRVPTVMQGQARLENARSRLDRIRRLTATRAISVEEEANATTDAQAAHAEHANQLLLARAGLETIRLKQTALAVARQQLADARVTVPTPTSPVAGQGVVGYVVTQRAIAEGTLVRPGTELFRLVIDRTLKLRVPVPERHGSEVRPGQQVDVFTAALPQPVTGTVARVHPGVEPTTRTFQVEILIPNETGELKSGNFAKAVIRTRLDSDTLSVPLSAVVIFAGITKVFLVQDGRAKDVPVTLGAQTPDWVEIVSPALPRGALVVTSGQTALANDSPVSIRTGGRDEG